VIGLDDFIITNEDAATDKECDKLIDWFRKTPQLYTKNTVQTRDGVVEDSEAKVCEQAWMPNGSVIDNEFFEIVKRGLHNYLNAIPVVPLGHEISSASYCVRIYKKGEGFFDTHVDNIGGSNPLSDRLFAHILYLNDVKKGGETEFPNLGVSVPPKKGMSLMFPCNFMYRHRGLIPQSHHKYVATAFITH